MDEQFDTEGLEEEENGEQELQEPPDVTSTGFEEALTRRLSVGLLVLSTVVGVFGHLAMGWSWFWSLGPIALVIIGIAMFVMSRAEAYMFRAMMAGIGILAFVLLAMAAIGLAGQGIGWTLVGGSRMLDGGARFLEGWHGLFSPGPAGIITSVNDPQITEKYTASNSVLKTLVTMQVVGWAMLGIYALAVMTRMRKLQKTLAYLTMPVMVYLLWPRGTALDDATANAGNSLFWTGFAVVIFWSILWSVLWIGNAIGKRRMTMDVILVNLTIGLAAVFTTAAIRLEAISTAMTTKLVHLTSLTLDRALLNIQSGMLLGVVVPVAAGLFFCAWLNSQARKADEKVQRAREERAEQETLQVQMGDT